MNKETLFEINLNELDNPFEREKLESLPNYILVELLIRHLKRETKAIEYIKEHIVEDDEYPGYMEMLIKERNELLEILGGNNGKIN